MDSAAPTPPASAAEDAFGTTLPAGRRLTEQEVDARARELLARMSLAEKLHQLSGDTPLLAGMREMRRAYNARPLPAGAVPRLGLPGVRFTDGPRGVVMYRSTCFPAAMARGATWDPELEERVGDAIGVEARSQGANLFAGVCVNLLRHPGWGRAQETYGEDPHHLGEMGAALVRGVQRHVMACVKHFAANSIENARFRVDVRISERVLREVYLPHFERCVDEGVAAVMTAYNRLNGSFCGQSRHLIREVLEGEWGFRGFVMSDFLLGIRRAGPAIEAGMDLEMPFRLHFGRPLRRLVRRGRVPESRIDDSVLRILRQLLRFSGPGEGERYGPDSVAGEAHRALAREVARKSMVLLRNDPVRRGTEPLLPIDPRRVRRIALLGRLATAPNLGDRGSSQVRPPAVVTALDGLRAASGGRFEIDCDPARSPDAAAARAEAADLAVLVVGYGPRDEGEYLPLQGGGDRRSLSLRPEDEALIRAVVARRPETVVVLIGGSAILTEGWRAAVPAILMAWYPGMEGGHALAELLLGVASPSGRLPCVFPAAESQLPFFDARARSIEYGLLHGQRLLDARGQEPAFPLGFGLGYTRFRYAQLELDADRIARDGVLGVAVDLTNAGERAGEEVVQLYAGAEASRVERPTRWLVGFQKLSLAPGETRRVRFALPARRLGFWDEERGAWAVEATSYRVWAGPWAREADLLSAPFTVSP
jgi:beta-glucosidase